MNEIVTHYSLLFDQERCAESIECSIQTVEKFVTKFSQDCTRDGRLTCADHGLIHRFKEKCTDLNSLNTDYYRKLERCLEQDRNL